MKPDTCRSACDLTVKSRFRPFCDKVSIDLSHAINTLDVRNHVNNVQESFLKYPAGLYNHPFNIRTERLHEGFLGLGGSTFCALASFQVLGEKKENSWRKKLSFEFDFGETKKSCGSGEMCLGCSLKVADKTSTLWESVGLICFCICFDII